MYRLFDIIKPRIDTGNVDTAIKPSECKACEKVRLSLTLQYLLEVTRLRLRYSKQIRFITRCVVCISVKTIDAVNEVFPLTIDTENRNYLEKLEQGSA